MGLTLMSVGLRFIGMSLSVIGVIGAISIYRVELQQLRLRIEENGVITLLSAELWIILGTILMALLIPAYVWYHETRPRHSCRSISSLKSGSTCADGTASSARARRNLRV